MAEGKKKGAERPCPTCGKSVWVTPARLKRTDAVYCSYSCHRKTRVLEKAPRWYGGVRHIWRKHLRRVYGPGCMICGWAEADTDLHHIVPASLGGKNEATNLILLCPNHHRLADRKKLSAEYLQGVVSSLTQQSPLYPGQTR